MSFLDDDNLLDQLVDETLEGVSSPVEMNIYDLEYHSSLQCYQLTVSGKTYTFPSNWGPFVEVHKREGEGVIFDSDKDFFNSVFGSLVGIDVKTAFLYDDQKTYMVFIPKKMEVTFEDLHSLIHNNFDFKFAA